MKNSYHKAFVPSRRVNYYNHVKSDLCDNITSRDVTKSLSAEQQEPEVRVPETYKKKKDRSIGQ